jgi:hypothetical protein
VLSGHAEKNRFADRPTAEDTSIRFRKIPEDWFYDGAGSRLSDEFEWDPLGAPAIQAALRFEPVGAALFYQLVVNAQKQKSGIPLANERRIMMQARGIRLVVLLAFPHL